MRAISVRQPAPFPREKIAELERTTKQGPNTKLPHTMRAILNNESTTTIELGGGDGVWGLNAFYRHQTIILHEHCKD